MESLQEFFDHWEKQNSMQTPIDEADAIKVNTIK